MNEPHLKLNFCRNKYFFIYKNKKYICYKIDYNFIFIYKEKEEENGIHNSIIK
jgi:hypothetical protein